jgi:fluoride exporter
MMPLGAILAVGLGSALGAVARYFCSLAAIAWLGIGFPWGTMIVNVLGSFIIGLYAKLTEPHGRLSASPVTRQFVLVGFCGGFTTFSIFSLETLLLIEQGARGLAGLNLLVSVVLWLLAVWAGYRLGQGINQSGNDLHA